MSGGGVARGRLTEERKAWRKNHPHGFVAKPESLPDGSVNLMKWNCIIPGKAGELLLNSQPIKRMSGGGVARGRLTEERKAWRKNHPHGFVAKPESLPDGSVNLMKWNCIIPGKAGIAFTFVGSNMVIDVMPLLSLNCNAGHQKFGLVEVVKMDYMRGHWFGFNMVIGVSMNVLLWLLKKINSDVVLNALNNVALNVHDHIEMIKKDYPSKPPKCNFPKDFFHLNVYQSGMVCLSILSESSGWRPAITVKQILCGIQDLLDTPNPASPAQHDSYRLFITNLPEYKKRVQDQAKRYPSKL
ncbi:SUMO-conjugating enzyme SCE1-like protein [Tanacetum coccineum]